MAITKLLTDLDNVQALSDKPNEIEGLTPDQLKAKFDEAGNEIKTYINNTLTAEVDSLITGLQSGWKTPSGTFTFASADAPTFVMNTSVNLTSSLSVGMKIRLTQTTTKYFFITAITTNTITLYGGTDYTLVNATISNVGYSTEKAPYGFPMNPLKWTVRLVDTSLRSQTNPTAATYYNVGSLSLSVPIGEWKLGYDAVASGIRNSSVSAPLRATLSTSSSVESDAKLTTLGKVEQATTTNATLIAPFMREEIVTLASKTTYYLLLQMELTGSTNISWNGDKASTKIYAVCAYL